MLMQKNVRAQTLCYVSSFATFVLLDKNGRSTMTETDRVQLVFGLAGGLTPSNAVRADTLPMSLSE